ncbi:unnamed protein product [Rotaria sp. Silwood1]|nr:unnamed protein product [Rotaria sp. Silwood1]
MELGEYNYSLISSPYDSFMRKHLQHYGYFSGRGEVIKKYGFFPSKSQLISSSSDSESSSSDEEQEMYSRTGYRLSIDQLHISFPTEYKSRSSVPDTKVPIRQARIPYGLNCRSGPNDDYSFEPRWPMEVEVLNEPRIKHISVSPTQAESFYKPTTNHGPFIRSCDENNGRVVFNYNPESCGYFIRSRIGGNREGCRQAAIALRNDEDTTVLFESRFESGNLMKAVQVGEFEYELYLRYDLYTKRNTQWFYFRMQNIRADRRYRFTIVNFFKPTSLYSYGMRPLLYSVFDAETKGIGWQRWGEEIVYYKNNLPAPDNSSCNMYSLTWTCKFTNNNDTYYFAHCYPYTYSDLQDYLNEIQSDRFKSQYCKQKVLCRTLAGNFIYLLTITNPATVHGNNTSTSPENQVKKGVVVSARVHPGETNASWMMKGLLDFLLGDSADAKLLRDNFIFKIVPMLNPDGVIVGNYRCSLSGRDLNRNYKTILKDAYPSIWHTREMIKRFMNETELVLYCDFHGHSRKQNVFVYGCENKHLPDERFKERIFPAMLSKNDPAKFSFYSCKFKVQKHKEGTGRVVMWAMGILNSYTLEATFCGSTQQDRAGHHFTIKDFESIGYHFLDSLLDYCDPDHTKEPYRQNLYDELLNGNLITDEDLKDFDTSYDDSKHKNKTRIDIKQELTISTDYKHSKVRTANKLNISCNINSAPNMHRSKSQLVLTTKQKEINMNSSCPVPPRNRILAEIEDNLRRSIQMKLISRGVNPASLADIDLDQFSSDDDSSDDVGSDSSMDDGLPKHLEAIAAAKAQLKKTRKKTVPTKPTRDTKRKDEIDKENLEKNKTVGLSLSKIRHSQFPTITELESMQQGRKRRSHVTYHVCKCLACLKAQMSPIEMPLSNDMTKPISLTSARRLKDTNNDPGRYESSNSLSNRSNRWSTSTTQMTNGRITTAEEKARRSQAEYYKLLTRDVPSDDREKQQIQQQLQTLDDDILITSTFFPRQPSSSENLPEEDLPVGYSSGPSCQTTEVNEPTLTSESRDVFTATYLLRRLNCLERESGANTNVLSTTYPILASSSRVEDDTAGQLTTDNDTDIDMSRTNILNSNEDGRQSTNAFVTNRVSAHLNERLLGTPRPSTRPKTTTTNVLQNRTVLDIRSIQPPMQTSNLKRIAEQQQHQRQRVMMVFGKQNPSEMTEKTTSISSRTFHLSINERRPDDSSLYYDSSSSVVSRLYPIQQDNISMNITSRFDSTSINRSQMINRIIKFSIMSSSTPKPVTLEGSCHCQRVKFSVDSYTPYPYMICHCLADTKTTGVFNCNIMGEHSTFKLKQGQEFVKIYQVKLSETESGKNESSSTKLSPHKRHFCSECGSYLWAYHDAYPQWIYPFASCIDTPLPKPDEYYHIMTDFKLNHVEIPTGKNIHTYPRYPEGSIEEWHKKHGLYGTYTIDK